MASQRLVYLAELLVQAHDLLSHLLLVIAHLYTEKVVLQNKRRLHHSTNFKIQFVGFAGENMFLHTTNNSSIRNGRNFLVYKRHVLTHFPMDPTNRLSKYTTF